MNQFVQLNQQYISGVWRDGKSQKILVDTNPYNGNKIAEFKLGSLADLDEAYRSAASAQKIWQEVNPYEKRAILEKEPGYSLDDKRQKVTVTASTRYTVVWERCTCS
jgi:acyl-CoA reductase-like NAD-dependent aldehyde dehydrogenase